MEMQDRINI
jgi:hypothetical protein